MFTAVDGNGNGNINVQVLHGEKKAEDRGNRARVEATFQRYEKDFAKMSSAVDRWQVSEFEQQKRKELSPFLRFFCGRVNTVTPLVKASEAVYEVMLSRLDLNEKIEGSETLNKEVPREICASKDKQFQMDRFKVVTKIHYKLTPEIQATWKGWALEQWLNNEDESVVTASTNGQLADQGMKWGDPKFKVKPDDSHLSNAETVKQQTLKDKAAWNVYSNVVLNLTLATVGSMTVIGVVTKKYLDRSR